MENKKKEKLKMKRIKRKIDTQDIKKNWRSNKKDEKKVVTVGKSGTSLMTHSCGKSSQHHTKWEWPK